MRKALNVFTSLFLTAVMIISSCIVSVPLNVKAEEYVVYTQSFEGEYGGWTPLGGQADLSIDSRHSRQGSTSLNVCNRVNTWNGPYLKTDSIFAEGETYTFEAWVHHDDKGNHPINWIFMYDLPGDGTTYEPIAQIEAGPDGWTSISGTATVPFGITSCGIYFESTDLELSFNIDAVKITGTHKAITSALNENGSAEYSYDFEEGFDGWKARGNAVVERSTNFSYTGRYSLYVSERTKFWNAPTVSISNLVENGVRYEYSAYVMYNGRMYENEHDFQIELQYNFEGQELYRPVGYKTLQKGNWSKISGEFTLPEGASDVMMYIQTADVPTDAEADANDLMAFYIDSVTIEDSTVKHQRQLSINIIKGLVIAFIIFAAASSVLLVVRKFSSDNSLIASAATDAMTGARNRNSYEIQISHLENRPDECMKLQITLCDVNFLKHINDNYGHQKGDDAIVRCAEVLLRTVGKKGTVFRTGGDEFVCITKTGMADKIRQALVAESQIYKGYPFAVATGSAEYSPEEDGPVADIKLILARSDKEMYKNKEALKKSMAKMM